MRDISIEIRDFHGGEVAAGYAAFRLNGVHLSFARWVPRVGPPLPWELKDETA